MVAAATSEEFAATPEQVVLERYRELILRRPVPAAEATFALAESITTEGFWPDIEYFSEQKTNWPARDHLRRIGALLRLSREPTMRPAEAERLIEAAQRAVDYWTKHRFRSTNWYHNEISTPQEMRDIAVLLGPDLQGERREAVIEVIAQSVMQGTSANLVWSAELSFHLGCLTGDRALMDRAARRIWDEVTIGQFEGVQTDGSFFQHDERVQNFVYGKGFAEVVIDLAWQVRGTDWKMPPEKEHILQTFLHDGCRWMARGRHNSPVGVDRAIAQPDGFDRADLRRILRSWREVATDRLDEVEAFLADQEADTTSLFGFRYFPQGDAAVYHHPNASVFLKTLSDRTHLTESFIGVNFKGLSYLNCGDHYVLTDGSEYRGLQPVWEWSQLPGITSPAYVSQPVKKRFVGGLSDGTSGLASMDHTRAGDAGYFNVRKLWAFHDGVMICLLGGWDFTTFWGQITTSVEQARWQGPITYSKDGSARTVENGSHAELGVDWVLHRRIGYLPFSGAQAVLRAGPQGGNWRQIDRDRSPLPLTEEVLHLALEHSHEPRPTGFAVVLDADAEKMAAAHASPAWQVVRNDGVAQIIRFADGRLMAAFYEATENAPSDPIRVSRHCVVMWDGKTLIAADPTHRGGNVTIFWNDGSITLTLPNDGTSVHHPL